MPQRLNTARLWSAVLLGVAIALATALVVPAEDAATPPAVHGPTGAL